MLVLGIHDPLWTELVQACPQASPFHSPVWSLMLSECYGYRPLVLGLMGDHGRLLAGLPALDVRGPLGRRRWVALPFTDYCPLLSRPGHGTQAERFTETLAQVAQANGLPAVEVHADLPDGPALYQTRRGFRHTLALSSDSGQVFRGFSRMHKRNIRRAERSGLEIHAGYSAADMQSFYRLHLLTRRRLGVPIQPRRFFRLLAQRMLNDGLGFVLSVRLHAQTIAAAVFVHGNGTLIYKYGASDPVYWALRPNNGLFWTAIRWGCERGYHTLDWGRSDVEDHGLREFKNGWGASEEVLTYAVVAADPPRRSSARPLRWALSALIRCSPPWVCQLIGEAVYTHAA
ncbi:MAG: GNAT family N-acetyltransferase [Chloroflexota bacterium]|nr:GNAT family N-acetyltransferase [Chloroflexota bacterium]